MTAEEWADIVGKLEAFFPSYATRPPEAWDPYREKLGNFTKHTMLGAIDGLMQAGQKFAPTVAELLKACNDHSRYSPAPDPKAATRDKLLGLGPEARYAVDFPRWCRDVLGAPINPDAGTLGALQGLIDAGADPSAVAERWAGDWVRDQFYLRRKSGEIITVADD